MKWQHLEMFYFVFDAACSLWSNYVEERFKVAEKKNSQVQLPQIWLWCSTIRVQSDVHMLDRNGMEEAGDPKLLCDYQWGEQWKHDLEQHRGQNMPQYLTLVIYLEFRSVIKT